MTEPPVYPIFIGGEHLAAASGKTFEVENPATGEIIALAAKGDETDIDPPGQGVHVDLGQLLHEWMIDDAAVL